MGCGHGGCNWLWWQIFNNNIFNKIKTLKSHFLNIKKPLLIEVDGGLNDDNIGMCMNLVLRFYPDGRL